MSDHLHDCPDCGGYWEHDDSHCDAPDPDAWPCHDCSLARARVYPVGDEPPAWRDGRDVLLQIRAGIRGYIWEVGAWATFGALPARWRAIACARAEVLGVAALPSESAAVPAERWSPLLSVPGSVPSPDTAHPSSPTNGNDS